MSKLARALALAAMLATMGLAGMTAAQAQATDHPTSHDVRRPAGTGGIAASAIRRHGGQALSAGGHLGWSWGELRALLRACHQG